MKAKELAAKLMENPDAEVVVCLNSDHDQFAHVVQSARFQLVSDGGWYDVDAVVLRMGDDSYTL